MRYPSTSFAHRSCHLGAALRLAITRRRFCQSQRQLAFRFVSFDLSVSFDFDLLPLEMRAKRGQARDRSFGEAKLQSQDAVLSNGMECAEQRADG